MEREEKDLNKKGKADIKSSNKSFLTILRSGGGQKSFVMENSTLILC